MIPSPQGKTMGFWNLSFTAEVYKSKSGKKSEKKCHVLSSAESVFGKYFGILVAVSKRHSQKLWRGVCWPHWAFNTSAGTLGLEPALRSGSVNDDTNARSLGNTFLPLSRFLKTEFDQWQQGRTSRSFLITVKTLSSFFLFCSYSNKITQNQQNECTYILGGHRVLFFPLWWSEKHNSKKSLMITSRIHGCPTEAGNFPTTLSSSGHWNAFPNASKHSSGLVLITKFLPHFPWT